IAQDPDNETLIFRKFDGLGVRNLLYMQAELFDIEKRVLAFERQISSCQDMDLRVSVRRWETFVENAASTHPRPEQELMKLVKEMREKTKEYQEALVLQAQVANLGQPSRRALRLFRRWFGGTSRKKKGLDARPILSGEARRMLEDGDDLAALRVPEEDDRLSQLLSDHWPLSGKPGKNVQDNTRYFRLRHVTSTVAMVSTIVAAVELVGAITGLYYVTNREARMGMIAVFTSLFGTSLCLLTNARRGEIFGASAAYAAVLVVFVSGDLGAPPKANPAG
ncbi:hypothetical protein EJ07DRAFT_96542, partial [Lizonia empirigonia]